MPLADNGAGVVGGSAGAADVEVGSTEVDGAGAEQRRLEADGIAASAAAGAEDELFAELGLEF